jgi:hypothetical protein
MRADQLQRMADLSEKLADVVLDEANPETWPAPGVSVGDMTKEERGDRYWCKKNAAASLALLMKVEQVRSDWRTRDPDNPADDFNVDKTIDAAEREAAKLLDKVSRIGRKQAFDAKVHGPKR